MTNKVNSSKRSRSKSVLVAPSTLSSQLNLQSPVSIKNPAQPTEVKSCISNLFDAQGDEQNLSKAYSELISLFENNAESSCAEYLIKDFSNLVSKRPKRADLNRFTFTAFKLAESNIGAAKHFLDFHIKQKIQFSSSQLATIKNRYEKVPGFTDEFSAAFNNSSPKYLSSASKSGQLFFNSSTSAKIAKYDTPDNDPKKAIAPAQLETVQECTYRSFAAKFLRKS